ncbi:MAG: hypothetical protein LBJ71_03600 [Holosporaceae bacterium]|jgi:hypothetical protein|nr:hypothetical protein [Holosporaceae bacterium]
MNFSSHQKVVTALALILLVVSAIYPIKKQIRAHDFDQDNAPTNEFLSEIKKLSWFGNEKIPKKSNKFRVILANDGKFGESQTILRLSKVFTKLGWEWCICNRYNIPSAPRINPDLMISLRQSIPAQKCCKSLLLIHSDLEGGKNAMEKVSRYDGFIQVVSKIESLEAYFAENNRKLRKVMGFVSVQETSFCDLPKKRLFYCGANWDKRRKKIYSKLYELLDSTEYFDAYGPSYAWEKRNLKSYRGEIASNSEAVIETMKKEGIALVLHSDEHLESSTTTSRIFEATAASCVIICDKHKSIMEYFGDSILYIDVYQSTEKIFEQIDSHVKWIQKNPQKAMEMARKAHKIFVENFTLEKEVEKIKKLYDEICQESAKDERH